VRYRTIWISDVHLGTRQCDAVRRVLGFGYWSLSSDLKNRLKPVVEFVSAFETALAYEATRRGLTGVVCGHIHRPALREIGPVVYANCGDWVENGTAIVEALDGDLQLVVPRTPAVVTTATARRATG
jgi:UDP-2,3-diacylglucosamine pyrophosphatase LpxH